MALGSGPDEAGALDLDWTHPAAPVATPVAPASLADTAEPASGGPPKDRRFRGDIDGLRAIAIVLVVGYHVLLPGFHGGFVGVDVFFVISGFLISRNLLSESTRTQTVGLITFWGKRIRRLVPALGLMVGVVVVMAMLILPSLDWGSVAEQARAALLYVSNMVFARQATDYFGGDINTSLFLHTWSLGVEEQFYVVWPFLFLGASVAARRAGARMLRPVLIGAFGVVFLVSLWLCVKLTNENSPFAFFGLPSRAWEFAAAGLLAAVPVPAALRTRSAQVAAGAVGVVLLGIALILLDDATPYPGLWPLLPVTATVLIVISGETGANPLSRVLSMRPLQAIGRVSYSWYLWHWPFILLAVAWLDHDKVYIRLTAALLALGVASVAYTFVENRVRFAKALTRSSAVTFAVGGAVTLALVLGTFGVQRYATAQQGPAERNLEAIRKARSTKQCGLKQKSPSGIAYCLDGDPNGTKLAMLIGDSHAGHWQAAFAEAASQQGYKVITRWHGRCPSIPVRVPGSTGSTDEDPTCVSYRAENDTLIDELHPDAVIVSNSSFYTILSDHKMDPTERRQVWQDGEQAYMEKLKAKGARIGRIVSTPQLPSDPIDCLAEKTDDQCAMPKDESLRFVVPFFEAEKRGADAVDPNIPVFDLTNELCPDDTCPVVIDGTVVYSDAGHLNQAFTMTKVPEIVTFLKQVYG